MPAIEHGAFIKYWRTETDVSRMKKGKRRLVPISRKDYLKSVVLRTLVLCLAGGLTLSLSEWSIEDENWTLFFVGHAVAVLGIFALSVRLGSMDLRRAIDIKGENQNEAQKLNLSQTLAVSIVHVSPIVSLFQIILYALAPKEWGKKKWRFCQGLLTTSAIFILFSQMLAMIHFTKVMGKQNTRPYVLQKKAAYYLSPMLTYNIYLVGDVSNILAWKNANTGEYPDQSCLSPALSEALYFLKKVPKKRKKESLSQIEKEIVQKTIFDYFSNRDICPKNQMHQLFHPLMLVGPSIVSEFLVLSALNQVIEFLSLKKKYKQFNMWVQKKRDLQELTPFQKKVCRAYLESEDYQHYMKAQKTLIFRWLTGADEPSRNISSLSCESL